MFGPIKNLVFDFDGTLVSTMPSVIRGLQGAIEHVSGKKIPIPELVATFGPAPQTVLSMWIEAEKIPAAYKFWHDFEMKLPAAEIAPFPEVVELLDSMKNSSVPMAIFTGRDRAGSLRIANAHGWVGKYFSEDLFLCGDDGFPPKPSGQGLSKFLQRHGWDPKETLMVGDHPYDIHAGQEAGTRTAAALWDLLPGEGTERSRFKNTWMKWDGVAADLRLSQPSSLVAWLAKPTH